MLNPTSKLKSLEDAAAMVPDGARVAFGGFAVYQKPMGFIRELVRQGRKNLTVVGSAQSYDVDLLAAGECLACVETSYVGLEKHGLARHYRRAVESGALKVVDYPEMVSWDRFRASQEGLAFWPVPFLGGNDIVKYNQAIKPFDCPITGHPMHAVPAADVDVVVIHALAADERGNVVFPARRLLPQSNDVLMGRSADKVVVTVEKIVSNAFIRKHSRLVELPSYKVSAVVELPYGAHPTPALGAYHADEKHYGEYVSASETAEGTAAYLRKFVHLSGGNDAYLETVGAAQLARLKDMDSLL
jgi:glutaconate CoA-transferase, subunit A